MEVPIGKAKKAFKIEGAIALNGLEDVLRSNLCGYIRITTDENGVSDYYIFIHNGRVIGAYAELPGGAELNGKDAYDRSMDVSTGIMDIRTLPEQTLKTLMSSNGYLGINTSTVNAPPKPELENASRKVFIRIAGVRVPIKVSESAFSIKGVSFQRLMDSLRSENFIGCLRITVDTPMGVQDGFLLFEGGKEPLPIFDGDDLYSGAAALEKIAGLFSFEGIVNLYETSNFEITKIVSQLSNRGLVEKHETPARAASPFDRQSLMKKYRIKDPDDKSIDDLINGFTKDE